MVGVNKYRLVNYFDVWGNEEDGYEVNDSCVEFDDLMITDDAEDKDIINYLIEIGFLIEAAREKVDVNNSFDWIEIEQKDTGYPLCRLERVV